MCLDGCAYGPAQGLKFEVAHRTRHPQRRSEGTADRAPWNVARLRSAVRHNACLHGTAVTWHTLTACGCTIVCATPHVRFIPPGIVGLDRLAVSGNNSRPSCDAKGRPILRAAFVLLWIFLLGRFARSGTESLHAEQSPLSYRLSSESPVLQGGDAERANALRYTAFAGTTTRVLALEYQGCRVPRGRRGPDRLGSEPCSNGASSRNPPRDSL
jgi:hypothetical protein